MSANTRFFWLLAGLAAVAIGAVGVVLPLLPTTPFLLVAAFAFARSSDRLNSWLREHRTFGPLIENWHRDGSIDQKVKRTAIIVMLATAVITWLLDAPLWVLACQIVALSVAAIFILTRPSPSEHSSLASAIRSHLPATRLLVLLAFSVLFTWLLIYLRMVDYFVGEGIDPDKIGHGNIALQVFDATTIFFGFLVFLAAGVVPLAFLFIRADPVRSNIAQVIWAAFIVALLVLSSAISY